MSFSVLAKNLTCTHARASRFISSWCRIGTLLSSLFLAGPAWAQPSIPLSKDGVVQCRVGQACTFSLPIFACDYASAQTILAGGTRGKEIAAALSRETKCQTVSAGRTLATEATAAPQIIYVSEAGQHLGYVPVGVFAAPTAAIPAEHERPVPMRVTTRLGSITLSQGRAPLARATSLTGQNSTKAVGVFRTGMTERRAFCTAYTGNAGPTYLQGCLSDFPDDEVRVEAGCETRIVTVFGRTFRLHRRSAMLAAAAHIDVERRWLWRDVATDEWLDGRTSSGEATVDSAFDILCPGRRPDAEIGVVYRDPQAEFPRELRGRWFDSRRACADPRRNALDYEEHGVLNIARQERTGNREFEFRQRINSVRRVGPQSWQVYGSHRIDAADEPEIFTTTTYTLTRDGLSMGQNSSQVWLQCR